MLDYEILFYRLLDYVVNENGGNLDSVLDKLGITDKEQNQIKEEFNWTDEDDDFDDPDIDQLIIEWARNDYDNGKPVEDYNEFSKLCEDMDIKPTQKLYKLYLDNYCYQYEEPNYVIDELEEE